jgi:hypothetical protein
MNSEEEQLRRRVEERQLALNEKVNSLKQRVEQVKRMGDINSAIKERPGIVLAGSVLTGYILRKFARRKTRNRNGAYQPLAPTPMTLGQRLWEPVIAIVTGVATRAAVDLVAEIAKTVMPWRRKADPPRQNSQNNP